MFPNIAIKVQGKFSLEIHYYVDCYGVNLYHDEFRTVKLARGWTIIDALYRLDNMVRDRKTSDKTASPVDPDSLKHLESLIQLHEIVRITKVSTGYSASYRIADGNEEVMEATRNSVFEALLALQLLLTHYERRC